MADQIATTSLVQQGDIRTTAPLFYGLYGESEKQFLHALNAELHTWYQKWFVTRTIPEFKHQQPKAHRVGENPYWTPFFSQSVKEPLPLTFWQVSYEHALRKNPPLTRILAQLLLGKEAATHAIAQATATTCWLELCQAIHGVVTQNANGDSVEIASFRLTDLEHLPWVGSDEWAFVIRDYRFALRIPRSVLRQHQTPESNTDKPQTKGNTDTSSTLVKHDFRSAVQAVSQSQSNPVTARIHVLSRPFHASVNSILGWQMGTIVTTAHSIDQPFAAVSANQQKNSVLICASDELLFAYFIQDHTAFDMNENHSTPHNNDMQNVSFPEKDMVQKQSQNNTRKVDKDFLQSSFGGVQAQLHVHVGEFKVTLDQLLLAKKDAVFLLDSKVSDDVNIMLEDKLLAKGQLVAVNDNFAVKLTEVFVDAENT